MSTDQLTGGEFQVNYLSGIESIIQWSTFGSMAKKNNKSKGQGSKRKEKVSTKTRKTPYDKGYDAINEILRENVYQQCTWNVSPSCNLVQQYANVLGELSSQHGETGTKPSPQPQNVQLEYPQQHDLLKQDAIAMSQADATARKDSIITFILQASKEVAADTKSDTSIPGWMICFEEGSRIHKDNFRKLCYRQPIHVLLDIKRHQRT